MVADAYAYDIPHWFIKGYISFVNGLQQLSGGDREDETNRDWMEKAALGIGSANVIELQSIVLARYRRSLRNVSLKTAEEDIKSSPIFGKQFEEMVKKAKVYRECIKDNRAK